jgi:hypothetical protein
MLIAMNDNPGDVERLEAATLETYLSVSLIADLFGVTPARVARDVCKARQKIDREEDRKP